MEEEGSRAGRLSLRQALREEDDGALAALQQFSISDKSIKSEIKIRQVPRMSAFHGRCSVRLNCNSFLLTISSNCLKIVGGGGEGKRLPLRFTDARLGPGSTAHLPQNYPCTQNTVKETSL